MFQKGVKFLFLTGAIAVAIVSCKKQALFQPPAYSEFVAPTGIMNSAFYVQNSENSVYKIPVGITNVSDKDRTIQFSYSSPTGATSGTQYTAPASVTIPAGKALDTLVVKGLYSGVSSSKTDSLYITISGGDAPVNAYNNVYKLALKKYCNVSLAELAGDYVNTMDKQNNSAWGPYASNITAVSTGATTATLTIKNFAAAGFGPFAPTDPAFAPGIKVNIDWTDPSKFTTSVPTQDFYTDATYGKATIKANGTGTFSSCDQTFTINYTVTVAAGSFGNFTTTIKR